MSEESVATAKPVYGPDDQLKTPEAADYCRVSKSLLDKLRVKGGGPIFFKLPPGERLVRYTPRYLDQWLEQDKRKSTSAPLPTRRRRKKAQR